MDKSGRATVSLHFSDELLIDASEFLNSIYEDLTQINEMLSFNDPTLSIEGTAMFFNGY